MNGRPRPLPHHRALLTVERLTLGSPDLQHPKRSPKSSYPKQTPSLGRSAGAHPLIGSNRRTTSGAVKRRSRPPPPHWVTMPRSIRRLMADSWPGTSPYPSMLSALGNHGAEDPRPGRELSCVPGVLERVHVERQPMIDAANRRAQVTWTNANFRSLQSVGAWFGRSLAAKGPAQCPPTSCTQSPRPFAHALP